MKPPIKKKLGRPPIGVAQRILENDLPELIEKLRGATVEENDAAPEEMPDDAARIANSDTPKPTRAQ
jgi:hypothetical protein